MLKQRLLEDMNEALKAREVGRRRLSAIRLLRAAVLNAEKAQGELDDTGVLAVLSREAKRLEGSITEYRELGRSGQATQLEYELGVIRQYLPQPLGAEEITALAQEAIRATGAAEPSDIGQVMRALMPKLLGRADGKLASDTVKRLLSRP